MRLGLTATTTGILAGLALAGTAAPASATSAIIGVYPDRFACVEARAKMFPGQYEDFFCVTYNSEDPYNPNQPHILYRGKLQP
ncbi:hypothetical protein ACL02S_19855 [Nocardia sp. 004]|uniref:hypothetical protein n=1 Tax=Nocardia sp. 004 TaxID=3385978 RepID=UPI0039A0C6AC